MADQQKETSCVDLKEGSSLLEEGIGKEFLSSWKSISMADDDAMDFSFDSVSKGKKKTFNFEKLDMDFSLDGEFDTISSLKMDMSDLGFSCSPKNPAKSKENKGGEISDLDFSCSPEKPAKTKENKGGDMSDLDFSCLPRKPANSKENKGQEFSGAKEGKRQSFDFNFDFNEMDSFSLDSSLLKGDTTSTSNLNKKGVTSHGSDGEAAEERETNDDEHVHASNDSITLKSLSSKMVETSKVEIMVSNQRDLSSIQDGSVSKASSSGKLDMLIKARTATQSAKEKDQEREISVKTKSSKSIPQDINNPPSQSIGQNDSNQDTIPDQHTEVYSPGREVSTGSGGKQNAINNKATYVGPNGAKLPSENTSPLQMKKLERRDGEAIMFGSSTQSEATNDPQPVKNDSSFENKTKAVVLKKISPDNDVKENKKSTLEGHLAAARSKPVVDEVMLMKDKENKGMQSKYFCKPEDNIPLKHNSLTARTKGVSFGCKRIGDIQLGYITKARESFKSNDSECGTRLVTDSTRATSESVRDELVLLGGKDDVKIPSNAWEGIVSDGIPSGGKSAENMQPICKEVKKSKIMLQDTDMSSEDDKILSSQVNPSSLTEKTARHATKMPVNLEAQNSDKKSFENLRVTREGNKISSVKAAKVGFKTSKSVGTNTVLPTFIHQKETKSSVTSEYMEIQGITAAKSDHLIDSAENQKPATPFLKRKTNEVSETDLVPLRSLKLSKSPSESRNSKECPEKVVEKVESRPNSLLCNSPTFGLQRPAEINMMELKPPASVFVEDNSNVEKAEAYTKELEDICNMLKKKHEEAKELIVRAIVNNNNLLMLNHPIYEEKIRKVQKLALQLMSKEIQT